MLSTAKTKEMEVGVAYGDVTPPIGTPLRGYYIERKAHSIHDSLQIKALAMYDGTDSFVWVTTDIIDIPSTAFQKAREHIAKQWNIPLAFVTIGSTHTHTGPILTEDYEKVLYNKIIETVDKAINKRIPTTMKAGSIEMRGISFNRRYFMADGRVLFNPGVLNPDIIRPAGPIDPEIGLISFEKSAGKPHAIIVNFAIHLDTIGGEAISADFPHFLEQKLRSYFQDDISVIFVIGACGNVNHIDVTRADDLKSFEKAKQIGYALAQKIIDHYTGLATYEHPRISAFTKRLILRTPVFPEEVIERASIAAVQLSTEESSTPEIRKARKIIRVAELKGCGLDAEVQVVVIGSVALVMLPTEIFVELGLAIKHRSPFVHTMVVTFTNHSVGYIPDKPAFSQGAYEVEVSMIEEGQGEVLVDTAVELLNQLHNS